MRTKNGTRIEKGFTLHSRTGLVSLCVFVLTSLITFHVMAVEYYVDERHPDAADQNPGTIQRPWKSNNPANQTVASGDIVFIKAGTYNTMIAPATSGTPTKPITYRQHGNGTVIIMDSACGILLDGKSHIVVQGINFINLDRFLLIQNGASYNTITYCKFDQGRLVDGKTAFWGGSKIYKNSTYNWIHHCQFSKYGYYTDDDKGCILDIGDENTPLDMTSHNLLEDSQLFHGGHHVLGVYSKYNVIRNNYFHNEPWAMGTLASDRGEVLYGNRNISVAGYPENSGCNLFEGNRVAYSSDPPDNVGASGLALNTSGNIVRFNLFYLNNLAGLSMSLTRSYLQNIIGNKIYHNTFLHNGINIQDPSDHMNSGIGFAVYSGDHIIRDNAIKNNLLWAHRTPYGIYKVHLDEQIFAGNWEGNTKQNPKFTNADLAMGNPLDANLPDLHLQAGSPCVDTGTHLTTIISPSGSGFSFTVSDASYFLDGWGIPGVSGDEIQLNGTMQRARITHLDYVTKKITLDKKVFWTQYQGITLTYEGNAPDAGAFEFSTKPFKEK